MSIHITDSKQVHIQAGIGGVLGIDNVPVRYVLQAVSNFKCVVKAVIEAYVGPKLENTSKIHAFDLASAQKIGIDSKIGCKS